MTPPQTQTNDGTLSHLSPDLYLEPAFAEIPRLLSLQDRNPFSKTYGCFHRAFWLQRTADFPTAINQMGAHVLALVWRHPFKNNPYHQNPKVLEWALAGVRYWMSLQHKDGSFDEWYPNERGWAGPTGYLVHAMADAFFTLGNAFPDDLKAEFREVVRKAGRYLVDYNEEFILANHHAIALLPIWEAYMITNDPYLKDGFEAKFKEFEAYCYDEGWSLEYDGVDIGYLSGTISFLSRLYRHNPDPRIKAVVEKAVPFTSYHLYPNGFYGGTIGSRQTGHFYHFGFEFWAKEIPLAAAMAEKGLAALAAGKLVPPGAQEDHYVLYRVAEYLEAHLAYTKRPFKLPVLPWEEEHDFIQYFPKAGIHIRKKGHMYSVVNLKRGGVVKAFDAKTGAVIENDCGWIAKFGDGKVATSQWNDPQYEVQADDGELRVAGTGNFMVMKTFTPLKMALFRLFMLAFGWHSALAYRIKAGIRMLLMVGARRSPLKFRRTVLYRSDELVIRDEFELGGGLRVHKLYLGDEVPVRYVPQSRYYQSFELHTKGRYLTEAELGELNRSGKLAVSKVIKI